MSNLHVIENVSQFLGTETKLNRMKELSTKMKELEAEYDMLKKQVIDEHFITSEEYRTTKGLLLASYKAQEMIQFQQSKFKNDHADIYNLYSEKKIIHKFLLK
jgi:hypothetical protein